MNFLIIFFLKSFYNNLNFLKKKKKLKSKILKKNISFFSIMKILNFYRKIFFKLPKNFNIIVSKLKTKSFFSFPFFLQKSFSISFKSLISFNFFLGDFLKRTYFFYANFFLGIRSSFFIFNIEYSIFLLRKALNFMLSSVTRSGIVGSSLVFCSNSFFRPFFSKFFSKKLIRKQSFIVGIWIKGFLTNFETSVLLLKSVRNNLLNFKFNKNRKIFNRLEYFYLKIRNSFKRKRVKRRKKFRNNKSFFKNNKNENSKRNYIRVSKYAVLPNFVLFSECSLKNFSALLECNSMRIASVGLLDSDQKVRGVAYPIPANNKSFLSFRSFLFLYKRCIFFSILNSRFSKRFKKSSSFLNFLEIANFFLYFLEKKEKKISSKNIIKKDFLIFLLYSKKNKFSIKKKGLKNFKYLKKKYKN